PFRRRHTARGIHTHIQRAVRTKTEAPRSVIHLWRRNTKIQQHAIQLLDATRRQSICQRRKTVVHDLETRIVNRCCIRNRIRILVEGQQSSTLTQPLQNQTAMPAAPESAINIDTLLATACQRKRFDRFIQQDCPVLIERHRFYICHRRQKEKLLSTSGTPAAIASASFSANVSASQISKWLPMPISMMSRVSPTAARSSGAIRMRLAVSNSTSEALPRKMRCQARAERGHLPISSRRLSHTGRGKSSKQPAGCLLKVRRPSHCNCNASRCRAGIVIRPFTSRLREEAPWNTLK